MSAIASTWNLWMVASIVKQIKLSFTTWPIFFVGMTEGNEEDIASPSINGRLSVDVSVIKDRMTETEYRLKANITLLITSTVAGDSYAHIRNEGLLEANIPYCIIIYKIGTDNDAVFGSLQWDSKLNSLSNPGAGPNARMAQTVYELHYEGTINAN